MNTATCSKRIQQCMDEKGWSQSDLYEKLLPICQRNEVTISKSSLSYYLSGKRTPRQDTIKCLSEVFCVDVAWLWGFGESESQKFKDEKAMFRTAQLKEQHEQFKEKRYSNAVEIKEVYEASLDDAYEVMKNYLRLNLDQRTTIKQTINSFLRTMSHE